MLNVLMLNWSSFLMGLAMIGTGMWVLMTGRIGNFPGPSRHLGALWMFPGLGQLLLLIERQSSSETALGLLSLLAGIGCFAMGGWLGLRYAPLLKWRWKRSPPG